MTGQGYNGAGIYVFRTRRPGLFGRVPILGRHTGYVGMSKHVRMRKRVHLHGSMKYNALPKPWSDLKPSWYFLPLPLAPVWVLLWVETLVIALLWPVYNVQKNRWNPRRIPITAATRQRGSRDVCGWSFNFRWAHALLWVMATVIALSKGWIG